jgi:tetratricopeptide (TPR) repeat protein
LKSIRGIAIALVVAAGLILLRCFCWDPLICSHVERNTRLSSLHAIDTTPYRSALIARANLAALRHCQQRLKPDPGIAMIVALNERLVGRSEDAVATYRRAIQYDRRPELYLNLGVALLESNQRQAAIEPLTRAAVFSPSITADIPDGAMRALIEATVRERDARIRASAR